SRRAAAEPAPRIGSGAGHLRRSPRAAQGCDARRGGPAEETSVARRSALRGEDPPQIRRLATSSPIWRRLPRAVFGRAMRLPRPPFWHRSERSFERAAPSGGDASSDLAGFPWAALVEVLNPGLALGFVRGEVIEDREILKRLDAAVDELDLLPHESPAPRIDGQKRLLGRHLFEKLQDGHRFRERPAVDQQTG